MEKEETYEGKEQGMKCKLKKTVSEGYEWKEKERGGKLKKNRHRE